jgi:hypothetical protein
MILKLTGPCQPVSGWGGVYSKIWAPFHSRPPQKKLGGGWGRSTLFFRKQNFLKSFAKQLFSRNFQNFQRRNPSFKFFFFQFQHARAPSPQVGPPFLLLFWGGVTPPTPPQVALPWKLMQTAL